MASALLIRLRPRGPWRYGPADGAQDSVDLLYRSDRLYSAVTLAMQKLGLLDEWLAATAHAEKSAVTFSSLFPFQGDTLFAIPPASIWPPPPQQVTTPSPVFLAKVRWNAVTFVPLTMIDTLLTGGSILADQWLPDPESGCLLRRDRPSISPMRTTTRHTAPVDRITHQTHTGESIAAVEVEPGAGFWTVARFRSEAAESTWRTRIEGAFRLLTDSGFGGRRSSGWGQAHAPEFTYGDWPAVILPKLARLAPESRATSRYWLLSLYVPGAQDSIDWSNGSYQILTRAGRIENGAGSGEQKKLLRMVAEGSVLASSQEPTGRAVDVAPENFAHPVYRSGLALALELPEITQLAPAPVPERVEEPRTEEAVTEPCPPKDEQQAASPTEWSVEAEPENVNERRPEAESLTPAQSHEKGQSEEESTCYDV